MFCPYCGGQIPDDSKFCILCGKEIDPEPAGNSGVSIFRGIQESNRVNHGIFNKFSLKAVVAVILGVLIACGGAFGLFYFGILRSSSSGATDYAVWLSDGQYQFVKNMNRENAKAIEIDNFSAESFEDEVDVYDGFYHQAAKITKDGKYLYYFAHINDYQYGSLYRADLEKMKENSSKNSDFIEKIDSNVVLDFVLRDDGSIVYETVESGYNSDYCLYYFNGTDSSTLAKEINYYVVSGNFVFYNKTKDGGDTYTLYGQMLGKDDSEVKIDSQIDSLFYVADSEHLVYYKYQDTVDDGTYDLFMAGYSTEPQEIADRVTTYTLSQNTLEKNQGFFFLKADEKQVNLGNYVENPHNDEDLMAVEPKYNDAKYQHTVTKNDWLGNQYTTTETDEDAYDSDYEIYEQSQKRLELMEYFNETKYSIHTYELYYFDVKAGKSTLVSNELGGSFDTSISGNAAGAAYFKQTTDIEKITVDSIMNNEDYNDWDYSSAESIVENYIDNNTSNTDVVYVTIIGGKEQGFSTENLDFSNSVTDPNFVLFNDGKSAALIGGGYDDNLQSDIYSDSIYVTSIKNNAATGFETIDPEVEATILTTINDTLVYGNENEFYMYRNGKSILILNSNIYDEYTMLNVFYEDGTALWLEDYSDNYGGTLQYLDTKDSVTKIADDVTDFAALDNNCIMYISNDKLQLYDGKNKITLSNDVRAFWTAHEKAKVPYIY